MVRHGLHLTGFRGSPHNLLTILVFPSDPGLNFLRKHTMGNSLESGTSVPRLLIRPLFRCVIHN